MGDGKNILHKTWGWQLRSHCFALNLGVFHMQKLQNKVDNF